MDGTPEIPGLGFPENNHTFLLDFAPGRENLVERTEGPADIEMDVEGVLHPAADQEASGNALFIRPEEYPAPVLQRLLPLQVLVEDLTAMSLKWAA